MQDSARAALLDLYAAAVAGADPARATSAAISARRARLAPPVHVIAIGKAAWMMSVAAAETLEGMGITIDSGVVVGADLRPPPHPSLLSLAGDHPTPGFRSRRAASAIGSVVARATKGGTTLVLLSGGASSLVAAPVDGVEPRDLAALFEGLVSSGADIAVINTIRKRFTRWGGGRLAVALAPSRVECLIVSDVVGDDLAAIGSGPCVPDPLSTAAVRALIAHEGLEQFIPVPMRLLLGTDAPVLATPKPGDPAFANVSCEIVLGNAHAVRGAAARARDRGITDARVIDTPLTGEAVDAGARIAQALIALRDEKRAQGGGASVIIWGGETTVSLGGDSAPAGGRCQELALAVAQGIAGPRGDGIHVLAAGTDGRDGTTGDAGAVVNAATWRRIHARGRDPARDLAAHASNAALDTVGALIRTGHSGTNVGDIVIGLVTPDAT